LIYYASSDTRQHVATSSVERLVDYCMNTAADGLTSETSVRTLCSIIDKNKALGLLEKEGQRRHYTNA
jgi:4-O-beta-D-mannosyl-D-glucose phosphorylase